MISKPALCQRLLRTFANNFDTTFEKTAGDSESRIKPCITTP
jgi:hypothetical protein